MKELNERQKKLYDWMIEATPKWITKEEITDGLSEYYPRHLECVSEHNSVVFATLRKDIRAINFSNSEKIIVSSKNGYKVATEQETKVYLDRKLKSSLTALKLYWKLKNKAEHNHQITIDQKEIETFVGE